MDSCSSTPKSWYVWLEEEDPPGAPNYGLYGPYSQQRFATKPSPPTRQTEGPSRAIIRRAENN